MSMSACVSEYSTSEMVKITYLLELPNSNIQAQVASPPRASHVFQYYVHVHAYKILC